MDNTEKKQAKRRDREEFTLARKVGRMGMLMHRYYGAEARSHGSVGNPLRGQGRILALLKAKPETTQRELSYLLDMRQQSLSELLAKLEEKGYVTRAKSEDDGRVTVVRLTEAGAEAAPSPDQMSRHADALDCLDAEERAQFEALVDKVTASLEEKLVALGDDPYAPPRRPRPGDGPRRPEGPRGPRGPRGPEGFEGHGEPRAPRHGWDGEGEALRQA